MKRMLIGIVISAVALYLWGFVFWGLGKYPWLIWKQPTDEAAARAALKEQFPENGPYFIPAYTEDMEAAEAAYAAGPVAFVHMLHIDGRPIMDPRIMVQGFLNNLVVIVLIALALRRVAPALPTWRQRARFVALVGLAATVLTEIGDAIWWGIDWNWKLYQAAYFLGFWMMAGIILAYFIESVPRPNAATEQS